MKRSFRKTLMLLLAFALMMGVMSAAASAQTHTGLVYGWLSEGDVLMSGAEWSFDWGSTVVLDHCRRASDWNPMGEDLSEDVVVSPNEPTWLRVEDNGRLVFGTDIGTWYIPISSENGGEITSAWIVEFVFPDSESGRTTYVLRGCPAPAVSGFDGNTVIWGEDVVNSMDCFDGQSASAYGITVTTTGMSSIDGDHWDGNDGGLVLSSAAFRFTGITINASMVDVHEVSDGWTESWGGDSVSWSGSSQSVRLGGGNVFIDGITSVVFTVEPVEVQYDAYEDLATNQSQNAYTGEHFRIDCQSSGDMDGFFLGAYSSTTATITALNGETITKVELTVGYYEPEGVVGDKGAALVEGDVISITGINDSSLTVSQSQSHPTQIKAVKVYYTGGAHTHADASGNETTFQAWTETDSLPTSGSWYLTDDVTLGSTWTVSNTVDLCLDGHAITYTGSVGSVISVNGGTLNLYDADGNHGTITGGKGTGSSNKLGGGVYVSDGAFNLYGGTIRDNTAYSGAGVYLYEGSFTMYGGAVSNNRASDSGGAISAEFSTITINDGEISGNSAEYGGGLYTDAETTMNLVGGVLSGNSAKYGGGLMNAYSTINFTGGSVTGNTASVNGAGLHSFYRSTGTRPDIVNLSGTVFGDNDDLTISAPLNITGALGNRVYKVRLVTNGRTSDTIATGAITNGLPGHGSLDNFLNGNGDGYRVSLTAEGEAQIEEHHEHSFTYSGGGKGVYDVIIATCTAENCPLTDSRVSINLDPPAEPVYDGKPKAPVVNGLEAFKEATGLPDSAFSYTYQSIPAGKDDPELDGLPTDAGRYEVWLAVNYGGSSPIRASVSFTIVPPHIHDGITFDPWTSTDSLPTSAGSYYLTGNVTLDIPWTAPTGTTNLCLNGNTISGGNGNNITINDASQTLNIYSGEDAVGEITAGVDIGNGNVNLYGGTLKGGVSNVGIFHMYGGTINSMGGISNGTDWFDGQFIMEGGLITGSQLYGVSNGNLGTFTMSGGSITGNRVGVYADSVVNISGSAKIQGNTEKNVELNLGSYIAVSDSLSADARIGVSLMTFVGLNEEQTTGVFTSGLSGRGTAGNFFSDNDSYKVVTNAGGEAQLMDSLVHIHDGITFEPWTNTTSLPTSGSWYLTADVTISSNWNVNSDVNLCLNGYGITRTGSNGNQKRVVTVNSGTLNLYDCNGSGQMHYFTAPASGYGLATNIGNANQGGQLSFAGGYLTGGYTSGYYGGSCAYVKTNGLFNLHGGTLIGNRGTDSQGGGAIYVESRTSSETVRFTMTGGAIMYNEADYWSGAASIGGTAIVSGGTISNNYSHKNGGLHAHYLIISGGRIVDNYGNEYPNAAGADAWKQLTLSGSPVITGNRANGEERNLNWGSDYKLAFAGDLDSSARIGISMTNPGVFTSGLPGHGDASNFISDDDSYVVSLNSDGEAQLMDPSVHFHDGNIFLPWTDEAAQAMYSEVDWEPVTASTYLPRSGNWVLTGNVYRDAGWSVDTEGNNTQVCLNGYTIQCNRITISDGKTLNLFDCQSTGEVKCNYISVYQNSDFAVHGCTITSTDTETGTPTVIQSRGTVTLDGGTYNGKVSIFGGELNLSGSVNISSIRLGTENSTIAIVGALTNTTPIPVEWYYESESGREYYSGVFTSGLSGRGNLDNFTSGNPDYVVTLSDDGEAMLTIKRYSFSYNENGAEGGALPMADTYTYDHGTTVTVQGNTGDLARSGYAFTGWNTAADGSGTAYNSGNSFEITSDTILYAQWTRTYNVTLHLNGGTLNGDDLTYYVEGVGATLPTDLTREGYNFDGWYDNEAMLGSPVTKIGATATGNREFWVKWFFKAYHVYVVTPDGAKTMYTGMEPSERVSVLKEMIAAQTGVPASRISLSYGGRVLSDNVTLADYNIQKGYTVRATFAPDVVPDFELFYTLNSDVDEDADRYRDYRVGEDVVATIYLRPLSDTVLQAFDIFMTHADGLVRTDMRSQYGELVTEGDRPTNTTHIRIQAIGKEQGSKIEVPIAGGEVYELARVTFRFADFVNYDIGQRITLLEDSNIAIANTPESFTPGIGGDTDGAELRGTYLITFDDNVPDREIQVPVPMLARQMLNETLPDDIPVRPGYIFRGWDKDPEAENPAYQPGGSIRGAEDTTLYAIWDTEMYTVTFYDEDGLTIIQNERYPFGTRTSTIAPDDPVKQGDAQFSYVFKGWEPKLSELVVADAAYTAVYEQIENTYTVIFQNWDGTILQTDTLKYGETPAYRGETPTHPDEPGKNYSFLGWDPAIEPVTCDITYYAQFNPEVVLYTVSFNNNGHGSRTPVSQRIGYGGYVNNPGELYDTGWIFVGWFQEASGENSWHFDSDTVTANTTLYAKWQERQYKMIYVPNGGSGIIPGGGWVPYTQSFALPDGEGMERNGYRFTGWNTRADGSGDTFSPGAVVTVKDNLISYVNGESIYLYAMWTADEYVINYVLDGGQWQSGQQNPVSYNVDQLPLTLAYEPVRTGYSFGGWYAVYTESGQAVSLRSGNIIRAGTAGNLTVTAIWNPAQVEYKVEHYQQYVDGDGYALYMTEYKTGLTGDQTTVEPLDLTGFTAQPFAQKTIEADGSTIVTIYYDRNYHSVSYFYSGDKPDGAPAVPATVRYKYGKSVVMENVPNLSGYEFEGWSTEDVQVVNGRFSMPDNDVVFTGQWIALAVPYTVEHWQQNVNDDDYTLVATDSSLTGKAGDPTQAVPNTYTGFTVLPYDQQTILSDGSTVVQIYYNRVTHTVRYSITGAPASMNIPGASEYRVGAYVTVEELEAPKGYTLGELTLDPTQQIDNERRFVMPDEDVTISGACTPVTYTITFDVTVGDLPIEPWTYTIESIDTLPGAESALYRFEGWKVTTEDGNWVLNAVYNANTPLTGKYGNVTLTAQWTEKVSYLVEEYKYAPQGWYMLRIKDNLDMNQSYAFSGEPMFVIDDPNYRIDDETYTFYTLISGTYVEGSKLTQIGYSMISNVEGDRFTVDYNGDVNNDEVVNIADANAVFQMLAQSSYGGYYGIEQLTVRDRLAADMVKSIHNADHRGSIEDVNAIVNLVIGRN